MENQVAFGALAASAAAVNVALQFVSGVVSLTRNPASDTSIHTRIRKRRHEEDNSSFIPAVIGAQADEEAVARLLDWINKPLNWWDHFVASKDPDPKRWTTNFRVPKATFDYICSLVKPDLESGTPLNFMGIEGRFIPVDKQVGIALRRLASGDAHTMVGELFGVGTSTVCKITWKFVRSMEKRAMLHMHWPRGEEMERVKDGFRKLQGLPNCCGAIDVTHIVMELQVGDSSVDWFDREGNYSMVVQAIVDSEMRFRDVFTGLPGSVTDSRALRTSGFHRRCENGEILNGSVQSVHGPPLREYVVGDEAYPLLPWLMTPYAPGVSGLLTVQDAFNFKHVYTRSVIDRAFGRLKGAWRILHHTLWRPDLKKLPHLILCCCLLHNIMIDRGDNLEDGVALIGHHDESYRQQSVLLLDSDGSFYRDALSNLLFFEDHQ